MCVVDCSDGVVTLVGSGQGGFEELVKGFEQKQVMFGVLKVLGKDVRKSVESIRPKFIFFTFIGEEVPVLQRARVSVQRPDIEKVFNGYAVRMDISGSNLSTFSKAEIAKELLRWSITRQQIDIYEECGQLSAYVIRVQCLTSICLCFSRFLFFSGGAHAPTHYVFGPSDELEVNPSPQ